MVSFLSLFLSLLLILFPKEKEYKTLDYYDFYPLIFTSFSLAQFLLGGVSLFIISINFAQFPIIFISLFVFILTLIYQKKCFKKYLQIWDFIKSEKNFFIQKSLKSNFSKIINILILLFITLIIFSSIGPINHPDAASYHVGFPFQFFKKGGFFVDGSYQQGLLGIGDFANLSFIQENNIWLIRFVQVINLPIIILFLSRKVASNIFLLAFITTPVFVMWSTIGKPLFLGESCLIIVYLIWKNNKTEYNFRQLVLLIISAIAFKISSLIIVFTLFIDILFIFKDNKVRNEHLYYLKKIITNKIFILSALVFFSLFLNRYIVTNNFAYPLLNELFNADDKLLIQVSEFLRNYKRDNLFPLNIFFGTSKSDLVSLGPAIFLIIVSIYFKDIKRLFQSNKNDVFFVGTLQLILLIAFAQGRADYYLSPLILFLTQTNEIKNFLKKNKLRILFKISLFVQSFILLAYLSFSIFQNINLIFSYEKNMKKFAYGYNVSKTFNSNYPGKTLYTGRNTRLYFSRDYLDIDLMNKCIEKNKFNNSKNIQQTCLNKYQVNQIISSPDYLKEKDDFKCQNITFLVGSRNPLNKNFRKQLYCVRKKIID